LPELLTPLLGLLSLLAVVAGVEFAVMAAAKALRRCGIIRNDGMVKSLVSDATAFNCGLIEAVTAKASVRKIQKQTHCTIVPQCSPRPGVRSIRTAVVRLTFVLAVIGEYAVFYIAQKTRGVGRISDGVEVITFDGIGATVALDPTTDCALVDKKFASEDSMAQYTYESCLVSLTENADSTRAVYKDPYLNFSTTEEGNIQIAMESQGTEIFTMLLLDFVTTFDYQRVAVSYKRDLKHILDTLGKAFGCTPLRQHLLACDDLTQNDVAGLHLSSSKILMKSARKQAADTLYKLIRNGNSVPGTRHNIDGSAV
jgi:hypothetical protein